MTLLMYSSTKNPFNMLKNSGFETAFTYAESSADWYGFTTGAKLEQTPLPAQGVGTVQRVEDTKLEGDASLKLYTNIDNGTSVVAGVSQDLILNPYPSGKTHCFSCMTLGNSSVQNGKLEVRFAIYTLNGMLLDTQIKELISVSDSRWNIAYVTYEFPVLNEASYKLVITIQNRNIIGTGKSTYYVDNLKLENGQNPSRYSDNKGNFSKYNKFSISDGILPNGTIDTPTQEKSNDRGGVSFSQAQSNQGLSAEEEQNSRKPCVEEWKELLTFKLNMLEENKKAIANVKEQRWHFKDKDKRKVLRVTLRKCVSKEKNQQKKGVLKKALDDMNGIRRNLEARYHNGIDTKVWAFVDAEIRKEFLKRNIDRVEFELE